MDKRKAPHSCERQEPLCITGGIIDKFFSMSDEEIEAMLKGSKWGLYIRLDNGEIISSQEYRERGFSATP